MEETSEEKAYSILRTLFKHEDFRSDLQRQAVLSVLKRTDDVFVSMPTGAGKSLCFHLPAVANNGITIVISPLIALMHDQLDHLHKLNIVAETINSSQTEKERSRVVTDLRLKSPQCKLL